MNTHPTLDRESFEKLLANAFAVQNSHMDRQSLSAVVEVQRLIQSGQLDVEGTAHLVADCARNVADATGICIGLLKGNQLLFRAGSGCGAVYVGQQVMASLTVSADTNTSGEILRVENAQVDTRIDAAICRQFGAKALLILPIYRDRTVAGVMEILFSEPHAFDDRELRVYRLMAGLIGEVMSHAVQVQPQKKLATELQTKVPADPEVASPSQNAVESTGPIAVQPLAVQVEQVEGDTIYQPSESLVGRTGKAPVLEHVTMLGTAIIKQAKRVFQHPGRWDTTIAAAVLAFVIACLFAYSTRRVPSPLQSSARPGSVSVEQKPLLPAKMATSEAMPKLRTMPARRQRRQMGNAEVEYFGDDVTVRHFTSKPAPKRVQVGANNVQRLGDDVTVRYFTPKPALVQAKQPVVR